MMVADSHINFEKLLENVICITNIDDNKDIIFGKDFEKKFCEPLWFCGH